MRADPATVAKAAASFDEQTSVPRLLAATARALVEVLDAPACTISRVIGDLLVDLVQYRRAGESVRLGHGYLISDYPLTREVLDRNEARTVFVGDVDADAAEVALLRKMQFDALLMTPLEIDGRAWGLVELYGDSGRPFEDEDAAIATGVVRASAERIRHLEAHTGRQV